MQDNKQIKPHDAYIKKYLQDPRAARDFFQIHLGEQVCKLIDFETLVLTNKSFVKANSTQIHSDMVFRFHSKEQHAGYLYVLLEHMSTPSRELPLRLIEYVLELLKSHLVEQRKDMKKEKTWPVIIPMIFYNGRQSPYPYQTKAPQCTWDPELAKEVGMFDGGRLVDVTIMNDKSIEDHKTIALMEKCMKYCWARNLLKKLRDHLEANMKLDEYFLHISLEYILEEVDEAKISEEEVLALFEKKLKREAIMTIAEKIEQRGVEAGRKEGRQETLFATAKRMIQDGLGLDMVIKYTGLSKDQVARLG